MGHLACRQVNFLTFSGGLGLLSVVQRATLAFFRFWVLIVIALVFHFEQDDHSTFLYAMAYVETNIYPFQVALRDLHALLPEVI
jgi:hypothetical protein